MRISQQLKQSTDTYIDDEMDPAHIELLQGLTVRLRGTVGSGGRTTFTGTGFILRLDAQAVHVITAKHNLHVAAGGLHKNGNALRDYFKDKIGVEFTKVGGQTVTGDIDDIWYPDGTVADNHYDVAVLVINAMTFAGHVATFLAPSRTIMPMFASLEWQRKKGNLIVDVFDTGEAQEVLANGVSPYAIEGVEYPDARKNYALLQFGYGLDKFVQNSFTRRVLAVANLGHPTYIPQTHEEYEDVFTFDVDNNNTSQPGDSGGPIFALDATGTHSWLIGMNLGGNYYSDKTDNTDQMKNNAFSVVTTDRLKQLL